MDPPALDPVIHQPVRLRIMTVLYRNRRASAGDLRRRLELTPGNLGSHIAKLEQAGYVKSGRLLVDLSFEVHYAITEGGSEAFRRYLTGLRALLDEMEAAIGVAHECVGEGERSPESGPSGPPGDAGPPAGPDDVADRATRPGSAMQKGESGKTSVGRGGAMHALSGEPRIGRRWT